MQIEVADGCYQAKIHKKSGSGFVSLPCCNSLLLAAWFFARARDDGTLETSSFKTSMTEVRLLRWLLPMSPCADSPHVFLCRIGCSAAQGEEQGERKGAEKRKRQAEICSIFYFAASKAPT